MTDLKLLVALWAVMALAFYFVLPLSEPRYAISLVMFAWPCLLTYIRKPLGAFVKVNIAACFVISLGAGTYLSIEWLSHKAEQNAKYRSMVDLLSSTPDSIEQVYVLSASGLPKSNPTSLRTVFDIGPQIVRVSDIDWNCDGLHSIVDYDYKESNGIITITATLPDCANFRIIAGPRQLDRSAFANHSIQRSDRMRYEVDTPYSISYNRVWGPILRFGQRLRVHVRPTGSARFVVEHGKPDDIAWFDVP